jgi:DNA-binding NarL/FixJ family response regulator
LPRVFLSCGDATLCELLRNSFHVHEDFVLCGEADNGIEAIKKTMELTPDLVVVEKEMSPLNGFEVAEAIKLIMPEVSVFLVTEQPTVEAEKEALSRGIDAVFEKDDDFTSLMMNARAVCGVE